MKKFITVFFIFLSLNSIDMISAANSHQEQLETEKEAQVLARLQETLRRIREQEAAQEEAAKVQTTVRQRLFSDLTVNSAQKANDPSQPHVTPKTVKFAQEVDLAAAERALQHKLHTDWTAVLQVVMHGKIDAAIKLLGTTLQKYSPEHQRMFLNFSDTISMLPKYHPIGRTLLHLAISQHKNALAAEILKRGEAVGFDPDRTDIYGETALHMAIRKLASEINISIIELLLQAGADPLKPIMHEGSPSNLMTPLHFIACTGREDAAFVLINRIVFNGGGEALEAALNAKNQVGRSPYNYARKNPALTNLFWTYVTKFTAITSCSPCRERQNSYLPLPQRYR